MDTKTLEQHFIDWENHVIGYGYGTGEGHTIGALRAFFSAIGDDRGPHCYNFAKIEKAVGPAVCWLLISALCRADIIEYGTSTRYGWLTDKGKRLQAFLADRSAEQLAALCTGYGEEYTHCYPDACNCGPDGYEKGRICPNPFWSNKA